MAGAQPTHDLEALRDGLAAFPADQLDPPAAARVGATLVLLAPEPDGHVAITYTRRQPHLSSHPGQISFPGGRVDPGEGVVEAALREAAEEVALDPSTVEVLGRLPAFYIPPSRFWMSAVVARWHRPHPLHPNPDEVAEVMAVSTRTLRQPQRWRAVPLTASGATWAWDLGPGRLLWGATAVVTGVLLQVADPAWSGGTAPGDLPATSVVRPWEDPAAMGLEPTPTRSRPRLSGVPDLHLRPDQALVPADVADLAAGVADAVDRLVRRGPGPVLVLAGPGRTGAAARAAAARIAGPVRVVDVPSPEDVVADLSGELAADLAGAGVVVDGLLGRGLVGALRGHALAVVRQLSATGAPLVAIDLPSGIHPDRGIVGDLVSADVTVAAAPLVPAHVAAGAAPFNGDLYLVRPGAGLVRAHVTGRPGAWAE